MIRLGFKLSGLIAMKDVYFSLVNSGTMQMWNTVLAEWKHVFCTPFQKAEKSSTFHFPKWKMPGKL